VAAAREAVEVEPFGERTFLVRAVPALLGADDPPPDDPPPDGLGAGGGVEAARWRAASRSRRARSSAARRARSSASSRRSIAKRTASVVSSNSDASRGRLSRRPVCRSGCVVLAISKL
jgi:hypothetical protein